MVGSTRSARRIHSTLEFSFRIAKDISYLQRRYALKHLIFSQQDPPIFMGCLRDQQTNNVINVGEASVCKSGQNGVHIICEMKS